MKKIYISLIIFISLFSLASCFDKEPEKDLYENHKKALSLVTNYSVKETNGFDYKLEQLYNLVIVNTHTINVRLDNNQSIGKRIEYTKELNNDISKEQYTEKETITYFKENMLAVEEENLNWVNASFDDFVSVNINSFKFNIDDLTNLNLTTSGDYNVLTFSIDDSKAFSFLKDTSNVKNLNFEIKTSNDYTKLVSFKMSYTQNITNTYYSFIPYTEKVSIELPK